MPETKTEVGQQSYFWLLHGWEIFYPAIRSLVSLPLRELHPTCLTSARSLDCP